MLNKLFHFHGGVKPAYEKERSTTLPIGTLPLPAELVIPLHQHVGGMPRPIVRVGQHVRKGQRLGEADGDVSACVHASTSGRVSAIEARRMPHSSGLSALCVVIASDGRDEWIAPQPLDLDAASASEIRRHLLNMGIVGLGGAVFPTHLKLLPDGQHTVDTLIINGAECEPFITCDDMLMRERAARIVAGVLLMSRIMRPKAVVIGIEDNKPQAFAALHAAITQEGARATDLPLQLVAVPTRYPAGGAKQLIRVLTGIEVPHGQRSTDFGVQCFNVATALAIHDAIVLGRPLISRVVTVAGNVATARNFDVLIGTPMRALTALCGAYTDTDRLIMGGPMMGIVLPGDEVPVVKASNCILVSSPTLFPPPPPEMPCIRCGECATACPADLQPFELYWFARARLFGKAQEYHLFDCIECGCCAYVCPSHIPLVDYYRFAKSEIWAREGEKAAADAARERHEFRLLRDEREKIEKAARLAARTLAGRASAGAPTCPPESAPTAVPAPTNPAAEAAPAPAVQPGDTAAALIAAALERARAQQGQRAAQNTSPVSPEIQAEIAAIDARRAQISAQARPHLPPDE